MLSLAEPVGRERKHLTKSINLIESIDRWAAVPSRNMKESAVILVKSILIKETTREERIQIVQQSLWGSCGIDCEFCSGCDNRGGGRTESIYQPYIDGLKELREINAEYSAPFVRG